MKLPGALGQSAQLAVGQHPTETAAAGGIQMQIRHTALADIGIEIRAEQTAQHPREVGHVSDKKTGRRGILFFEEFGEVPVVGSGHESVGYDGLAAEANRIAHDPGRLDGAAVGARIHGIERQVGPAQSGGGLTDLLAALFGQRTFGVLRISGSVLGLSMTQQIDIHRRSIHQKALQTPRAVCYDTCMDIHGKTALITGGAKRIGRTIALGLAREGARVILHHRASSAEVRRTQSELARPEAGHRIEQADLSRAAEVRSMVSRLGRDGIHIDILVNSASLFHRTPVETVDEADWDTFQDANLKGPFLLSVLLGRKMLERGSGSIVNIADWSGLRPYRGYIPYCVSKGGLITLTKALARDLAPAVRVNAVAPGPVLAPPDMSPEDLDKAARRTLLGRWGSPEDIAGAVRFVLTNSYLNGTVLCVDGGRSIA